MKRTIGKLGDTYLRGIDLFCWSFCDMPFYSTTTTEILNPRVGVENETLHKPLIIKIDFTIKRTTIIAMLQHLIVFLAIFRFRPNTSQTEKTSLTLFCRKFWLFVFGHNQLVDQPLTVALRERKTLETSFHKIGNALNEVQFNFQSNRTTNHMVYWLIEK